MNRSSFFSAPLTLALLTGCTLGNITADGNTGCGTATRGIAGRAQVSVASTSPDCTLGCGVDFAWMPGTHETLTIFSATEDPLPPGLMATAGDGSVISVAPLVESLMCCSSSGDESGCDDITRAADCQARLVRTYTAIATAVSHGAATLVLETPDQALVDDVYLRVVPAAHLDVGCDPSDSTGPAPIDTITLAPGAECQLFIAPRGADGLPLVGSAGYAIAISDTTVATLAAHSLLSDGPDDVAVLEDAIGVVRAGATGTTTLTVTGGGFSRELSIVVK